MPYDFMECPKCGEVMFLYDFNDGEKKCSCHNVGCNYEEYDGES